LAEGKQSRYLSGWQVVLIVVLVAGAVGFSVGLLDRNHSHHQEWAETTCIVDAYGIVSVGTLLADDTKVQQYRGEYTVRYLFKGRDYSQKIDAGFTDSDRRWVEQRIAIDPGNACPFNIRVNPQNPHEIRRVVASK